VNTTLTRCCCILASFLLLGPTVAAPVTTGQDPETGLRFWEWRGEGVLFRLDQRLPDQTRAFFLARGFDRASADQVATRCVFQSRFRNTADAGAVTIDLDEWRIQVPGDAERRLLTREVWTRRWQAASLPQPARIAFEWSLLPTRQRYAPGDYNWGMTSYGLAPGQRFDLVFGWRRDGRRHHARLEDIQCPPDIHPEPQ